MSRDVLSPRCGYMGGGIYKVETVDVTLQRMVRVAFPKKYTWSKLCLRSFALSFAPETSVRSKCCCQKKMLGRIYQGEVERKSGSGGSRLGSAEACASINLKGCHAWLEASIPSRKRVSLCVATRQEESVVSSDYSVISSELQGTRLVSECVGSARYRHHMLAPRPVRRVPPRRLRV